MKNKIEKIKKYRDIQIQNIKFIKSRLGIQAEPGYDPFAKSGGQWSEPHYIELDLLTAQEKLRLAEDWLIRRGISIDNIGHKIPSGLVGIRDHFPEWKTTEFNGKDYEKDNQDPYQTEGYSVQKGWPGFYYKANGPNRQEEESQQKSL
jgi:hypothetical protein